jgi:hypothetical protein
VRRVHTRRRAPALLARNATRAVLIPGASWESTAPAQSQAYCGPGHGQRWPVEPGSRPPGVVALQTPGGICSYRLLVHPRTHGPARDHQGRYPYLPVVLSSQEAPSAGRPSSSEVSGPMIAAGVVTRVTGGSLRA